MPNPHLGPDKARGKWAPDSLDRGDAKLEDYVLDYSTKDDGQMIRVKSTATACTPTMGRMPDNPAHAGRCEMALRG
ncbi:hypothetical protein M0D69_30365 [Caballeronia sp. SEWSISQ10-4 2]|uniref:hypothetical protein n=1 Tax=Caballeronia sp. SEWSISQ10-4 2 TaxID=2937438 RepID=UPI00264EA12A|nr:hypothetical protein [Caballeronia sp. SEWSISQ10-4 2]MDN7182244.1 hypothetical protein [Caballeronia sp. SEWSISQ10-4 2]